MSIGDIGVVNRGQFHHRTSLQKLGISFDTKESPHTDDLEYTSSEGVKITYKMAGEAPIAGSKLAQAEAGVAMEFSRGESMYFRLKGVHTTMIDDIRALEQAIRQRKTSGDWENQWVIVTEVKRADSATIFLSSSANGQIELRASGKVNAADIDLADTDLGLQISRRSDMGLAILAKKGITPLFKGMRLRTGLFHGEGRLHEKAIGYPNLGSPSLRFEEIVPGTS